MENNTLILKNSAILFLRLIITSILGLITTRLLLNGLGASDFGLYNVVGGFVVMMAFLNTVMISTSYRFIAYEMGRNDHRSVNKVFNVSLLIHFVLAVIVILLTESLGVYYVQNYLNVDPGRIVDAIFVLRFSTYAMVFSIISIPFQGLVTAQENFKVRATIEVIRAILILGVAIFVTIHTGNKLRFYAFMMMLVSSVPSALFIIYCKVSYKAITKWEFQSDVAKYKEMLNFSVWIMFGAASSVAKNQGTSLIINSFFGTVLNAAFGIAHQIDSLVRMFASNLGQAVVPQITKSFSGGNKERSIKLVAYTSKYTCFLMLIPAIPILLETEYLLTLWVKNVPSYTVIFSQLMVLGALVDSLGGGISSIVQATGKIKYFQIILSTTSLLSLPISYFLFNAGYPPPYLIIAFLSTSVLNVVLRQILLKKLINFDVKYFIETAYFKIFYVVIMLLPLFYIKTLFNPGLPRFILLSFFSVSWVLFVIYFIGIEKKEKTMIKQIGFNLLSFRK